MKIVDVKRVLATYDENKGIARTYLKEEPHIRELRTFVLKLEDDDEQVLSPGQLVVLASILNGKNTLNYSASSDAFKSLAAFFGGFEAVSQLQLCNQLNPQNVAFIEKYPLFSGSFARTVAFFVEQKMDTSTLSLLVSCLEKMRVPENFIDTLKLIQLRSMQPNMISYIKSLCLLNNQGLYTDDVAECLKDRQDIEVISNILLAIQKSGLGLLDQNKLTAILKLQNPGLFSKLFFRLKDSANNIDILCNLENYLKQYPCPWVINEEYYAFEMASVLIALKNANCLYEDTCAAMLKHPDCFEINVKLINFLSENNLITTENIIMAGTMKLPDGEFLAMLEIVKNANLLTEENLSALFINSNYTKTLLSGLRCLVNGNVFTQSTFEDIISNPLHALTLAEIYKGKPSPESQSWLQDKGAMDFIEIRKNARVLALLHSHNCFFPPVSASSEKEKKDIVDAQKYSLIKIAEYCGDGSLEPEIEHNIASMGYFSL